MKKIIKNASCLNPPLNFKALKDSENTLLKHRCLDYYKDMLLFHDGGYFFNNALHLFSASSMERHQSIFLINNHINGLYGKMVDKYYFFAEDVFGNLFGFYENTIVLFSIDSGEIEPIAQSLEDWYGLISSEPQYYTGYEILQGDVSAIIESLKTGHRLGAIFPFTLGGGYNMDNLALLPTIANLEANASICAQIKHLPDGKEVTITPVNVPKK